MVFSVREVPAGAAVMDSAQTHGYPFEPAPHINNTTLRIAANQCHMTQLMAQMSKLVVFSGDLFNNLLQEASSTYQRINGLATRIDNAVNGVNNFETRFSSKSGQSLMSNPRVEFTNVPLSDSSLFTTENRPEAVKYVFSKAEQPPKLHLMDTYIEGSEHGLKALDLYTSPRFFLDEWIAEQMKLRQAAKEERKKRREEKKARRAAQAEGEKGSTLGPAKPKRLEKVQYDPLTGERIVVKGEAAAPSSASQYSAPTSTMTMAQVAEYSWSAPPPTVEQPQYTSSYGGNSGGGNAGRGGYSAPPPPQHDFSAPPPPPSFPGSYSAPPPPPSFHSSPSMGGPGSPPPPPPPGTYNSPRMDDYSSSAPAPPPAPNAPPPPPAPGAPPPPPVFHGGAPASPGSGIANALAGVSLKSAPVAAAKPVDSRSDLLSAIRGGRALNKVEAKKEEPTSKTDTGGSSVASILARRIAIVGDSDSESDDDDGDEEWD